MAKREIDPDKVIEMGKATLRAAIDVEAKGRDIDAVIQDVAHLVGGAPAAKAVTHKVAGLLAEQAGEAHRKAIAYVDDAKALDELTTWDFWLPQPANLIDSDRVKAATSDEFGAGVLGVAAYLMSKYDKGGTLLVPRSGTNLPANLHREDIAVRGKVERINGKLYVYTPGGLLVEAGSSGDPAVRLALSPAKTANIGAGSKKIHPGRGLKPEPVNPSKVLQTTGKALGWVGAGLTVYGAGYNQWQQDAKYHPDMGTGERVARAAGNAIMEGGAAAGFGYGGAVLGAKAGAVVGSFIAPGVGTAIGAVAGGLVGGFVGGFAGSKAGSALGRFVKGLIN